MPTLKASEFKTQCLSLMDRVARTGESITITKHGKPIAQLNPYRPPRAESLIGLHRGQTTISGDLIEAVDERLWESVE